MASIGFSEFSFGFAYLHELLNQANSPLSIAPVFPSQQSEAKLGYDVKLPHHGSFMFLQFKVPELIMRNGSFSAYHPTGYFKMKLHRRNFNAQHRLLWECAQRYSYTFYVAPALETPEEFNAAFLSRQVLPNSRVIEIKSSRRLNTNDNSQHFITWERGSRAYVFRSRPTEGELILGDTLAEHMLAASTLRSGNLLSEVDKLELFLVDLGKRFDSLTMRMPEHGLTSQVGQEDSVKVRLGKIANALWPCGISLSIVSERNATSSKK